MRAGGEKREMGIRVSVWREEWERELVSGGIMEGA